MNVNKSTSEIELAECPIDLVEQIAQGKGQEKIIIPEILRIRDMMNVIMTGRQYITRNTFSKNNTQFSENVKIKDEVIGVERIRLNLSGKTNQRFLISKTLKRDSVSFPLFIPNDTVLFYSILPLYINDYETYVKLSFGTSCS